MTAFHGSLLRGTCRVSWQVDLAVCGHHHSYQRTCPLANGTCAGYDGGGAARGPVYLVIGNAGAGLSLALQAWQGARG
jgi:hypothetical protein